MQNRYLFLKISVLFFLFFLAVPLSAVWTPVEKKAANKAVRVSVIEETFTQEIDGQKADEGKTFLMLKTSWENIHPKQKVEKSKLDGKVDRTMGAGGLSGKKKSQKEEYVEKDVAYLVKKMVDHAYVLADGLAYPLHKKTEKVDGGIRIQRKFGLSKLGETKEVNLVFTVPEKAANVAFRFFDYRYGHIELAVLGDPLKARGSNRPPGEILGEIKSNELEIAAHTLDFVPVFNGKNAPSGRRYAVVQLSGRSLSGGDIRNIVEIKTGEYVWLRTGSGSITYGMGESGSGREKIRFTPEVFMAQKVIFLIPDVGKAYQLGLRVKNNVFHIDLTGEKPDPLPEPKIKHTDGNIMELMVFGARREKDKIILDLGIKSLRDGGGLEIKTKQQFIILSEDKQVYFDKSATLDLVLCPPNPFIVPPGESVRFELAYSAGEGQLKLRFRGYKSQADLEVPDVK